MISLYSLVRIAAPLILVLQMDGTDMKELPLVTQPADVPAAISRQSAHMSATDANFVFSVGELQQLQTMEARLALLKSSDPGIERFAEIIIDDDAAVRNAVIQKDSLAAYPATLSPESYEEERRLSVLEGEAFDTQFSKNMVKSDQRLLAMCRHEITAGNRQGLQGIARTAEPQLKWQLSMARFLGKNPLGAADDHD